MIEMWGTLMAWRVPVAKHASVRLPDKMEDELRRIGQRRYGSDEPRVMSRTIRQACRELNERERIAETTTK